MLPCYSPEALNISPLGPLALSRHRFIQFRDECLLATRTAEKCFVHCKTERLVPSTTGTRTFWSLAEAVPRSFCLSNFPSLCSFSNYFLCETYKKVSRFASSSTLPSYPTLPPTSVSTDHLLHALLAQRISIMSCILWKCANYVIRTVFHHSSSKYGPLNWSLVYHPFLTLPASFSPCGPIETCRNSPLLPNAGIYLTQTILPDLPNPCCF